MEKKKTQILSILVIIITIVSIQIATFAHSGRTDANGGHKDNKNKSGLGSYHYHCGGHPAHLHTNGVCPYSTSNSSSSSSTKTTTTTTSTQSTIKVTAIHINENIEDIEVGKKEKLTASITPSNATDKSITWESSDESIATVNSEGEIRAKKPGIVDIIATTSNGMSSTITINVIEPINIKNNYIEDNSIKTNLNTANNIVNDASDNKEGSNMLGGIIALGALGGGGYWGYKKYKSKDS